MDLREHVHGKRTMIRWRHRRPSGTLACAHLKPRKNASTTLTTALHSRTHTYLYSSPCHGFLSHAALGGGFARPVPELVSGGRSHRAA